MYFADSLTLDAPRRTADGYLAVRARSARTGVYQYTGREVDPNNEHGLRDQAIVNVLRDENTVFDTAAARSFIGKPVTDDHPHEAVTSENWRDHARGTIMGAMRDGEYLAFDLLLTDAATIAKVDAGKRELSNGYGASLEFGDFKCADGTVCQARQSKITGGNHVALVKAGRAGSECAIKDGFAVCDALPSNILDSLTQESPVPKIVLIDGLSVDVANVDTAATTIATLIAARDAASTKVTGLESQVANLTAEGQTKDAKIATLEQQVKDAKPTPAQLRDAGKALMVVADQAKALGVTVSDDMDEAQIKAAAVTKHMGDAAKDWTAEQIAASFAVLAKDTKPAKDAVQPLGSPKTVTDGATAASTARAQWLADKQTAYRGQAA
ncbi:DUF2213 domain-containing protein [Novosphingobium sp. YJ-S2-02]|uniref:DUF2213 domain-containing protein n=1 Tax=Novosphingobium aureum TaxID=2792964 RepID=A0A931MKR0_9SPHN|nr:DUF2213 domain-containing protein [Novosphingobium aureum]MBH0112720.1 DUF2213 domain-containing protein [Novosphingobium aureum]